MNNVKKAEIVASVIDFVRKEIESLGYECNESLDGSQYYLYCEKKGESRGWDASSQIMCWSLAYEGITGKSMKHLDVIPSKEDDNCWFISLNYNLPRNVFHLFSWVIHSLSGELTKVSANEVSRAKISRDRNGGYIVDLGEGRVFRNLKDIEWIFKINLEIKNDPTNPNGFKDYLVELKDGLTKSVKAINEHHAKSMVIYGVENGGRVKIDGSTGMPIGDIKVNESNIVSVVKLKNTEE